MGTRVKIDYSGLNVYQKQFASLLLGTCRGLPAKLKKRTLDALPWLSGRVKIVKVGRK